MNVLANSISETLKKKIPIHNIILFVVYADKAEAEQDKDKLVFNCYQRAHQVNQIIMWSIFKKLLFTELIFYLYRIL